MRREDDVAELLVQFDEPIIAADRQGYVGRVWGREDDIGRWIGWLEFVPRGGGAAISTDFETVQPNRRDLEYWATGLTLVYLDGALGRALHASGVSATPHPTAAGAARAADAPLRMRPPLDPFNAYLQGEGILRAELRALSADRLRDIVVAYGISSPETSAASSADELQEQILVAARRRLSQAESGLTRNG
jgi:hypothetical protein